MKLKVTLKTANRIEWSLDRPSGHVGAGFATNATVLDNQLDEYNVHLNASTIAFIDGMEINQVKEFIIV